MAETPGIGVPGMRPPATGPRTATAGDGGRRQQTQTDARAVTELPKERHIIRFEGRDLDLDAPRGTYLDILV